MIVSVTSGATNRNVAELAVLKAELGITDTGSDAKLARIIGSVGREFAGRLDRDLWRQGYVERLGGGGGLYLPLSRWPVESVSEVLEGTATIAAADYEILEPERSALYRVDGWRVDGLEPVSAGAVLGEVTLGYQVTYVAGWLPAGQVSDWSEGRTRVVGDWVRASDAGVVVRFECTSGGVTDTTEPSWDETVGNTTTDGTAEWTAQAAAEFPADLEDLAVMVCAGRFRGSLRDPGIASESMDGLRIAYRPASGGAELEGAVVGALARYR